jgi:arginine deiminase
MRERGVEVLYVQDLLRKRWRPATRTPETGLIGLVASDMVVGVSLTEEISRSSHHSRRTSLAKHLIGGRDGRRGGARPGRLKSSSLIARGGRRREPVRPAAPARTRLFTRDSSCWIYGGVSINPMYWPAGRREAYNMARSTAPTRASRTRPSSTGIRSSARTSGSARGLRQASLEGGDVEIIGKGTVAIGMSERTSGPDDRAASRRPSSRRAPPSGSSPRS